MRNEHAHTLRLMADMRDLVIQVGFFIQNNWLAAAVGDAPSFTTDHVTNYYSRLMIRIPGILAMSRKNLDNGRN